MKRVSLAVSILVAVFFSVRWLRKRKARKRGHKLDVYIKKLLNIEKRQVGLDADSQANDLASLQKMLDEVTFLRQEALGVFSVHELNEDRGADCFIVMCHALSHKINAKLSRQRLDIVMYELIEAVKGVERGLTKHSAIASTEKDSTSPDRPDR